MPASNPWQAGQKVGARRFTLIKQLGRGGMGVVWLAHDTQLDEPVALKFLPPEIASDSVSLNDLCRETVRSHKLTHPNIIRIHDFVQSEEAAFISMEYVDGSTLSDWRLQQPKQVLSWEQLAPLVQQLCAALEYAHGEGVIHRDLKPANLMVDKRNRLKLADFGIAAMVSDSVSRVSLHHSTSGTLPYMSPQQLTGKRPQATDDIYALGAALYELLTSKPPFYTGDVTHQVLHELPEPMEERLGALVIDNKIPGAVAALIMACLAKEPEQRPQSARAVAEWIGLELAPKPTTESLAAALFPEMKSSPVEEVASAPAGPARGAAPAGSGRNLAAVAVVVLVMAGAFWFWKGAPTSDNSNPPADASKASSGGPTLAAPVSAQDSAAHPPEAAESPAPGMPRSGDSSNDHPSAKKPEIGSAARATTNNGLISWWKADGNALDSAGKNNGTLQGAVSFAKGLFGQAFLCHGGYVRVPDSPTLRFEPGASLTFSAWAWREKPSLPFHIFGKREGCSGKASNYQLGLDGSFPPTPVKQWLFWTLVCAKGRASVYTNGAWAQNWRGLGPTNGAPFEIGDSGDCNGRFYGLIEDVRIYGRAFSPVEVKELFDSQRKAANVPVPSADASADAQGPRSDQRWTNSLSMVFVPIPGTSVKFSIWDTRVQDYAAYAEATSGVNPSWRNVQHQGLRVSGGPDDPVTMVSWEDAKRYCRWLTEKERLEGRLKGNQGYRLPTDAEWSLAVGLAPEIGNIPMEKEDKIAGVYPWGTEWPPPKGAGNYADITLKNEITSATIIDGYDDGYATTSPVGMFKVNKYGLYDMGGNVYQSCEDWFDGEHKFFVVRGASWDYSEPRLLLSSHRGTGVPGRRQDRVGFRCVLAN